MIDPSDDTIKTATVWLGGGELICAAGAQVYQITCHKK
jgi:hypothetical protein